MGSFYTNYTLRGPSQQDVAKALAGRKTVVTPARNGCVVVFDEQADEQDQELISDLASRLSSQLRCPVLAVLNHDDDILWYRLYENGELADEYDSCRNEELSKLQDFLDQSGSRGLAPHDGAFRQGSITGWSSQLSVIIEPLDLRPPVPVASTHGFCEGC